MSIQYDIMQKQAEEKARRLQEAQQKLAMKSQVISPNKGIISGDNAAGPETTSAPGANVAGTAAAVQGVTSMVSQKASGSAGADIATGAGAGAATGASIGSMFPGYGTAIGAGIGAVVGGVTGAFKSKAESEAQNRKTEAEKLETLGKIENERQKRVADALKSMGESLSTTFNNNGSGFIRI